VQQLYDYQLSGVSFLRKNARAGLFDETGLGKTVEALEALNGRSALVVCPLVLFQEWEDAAARWAPHYTVVSLRDGRGLDISDDTTPPCLFLINYARVARDETYLRAVIEVEGITALIVDEAHFVKNRKAQRSAAIKRLARRVEVVWLLTGTPPLHLPHEMWHLLHIIAPRRFSSYWRFFDQHVTYWRPRPQVKAPTGVRDLDGYLATFSNLVLRRTKDEVLPDLPELRYIDSNVALSDSIADAYKAATDATLKDPSTGQPFTFDNALTKMTWLRRLSSGTWPSVVLGGFNHTKGTWLLSKLAGFSTQAVLLTYFTNTRDAILDLLSYSAVTLDDLPQWKAGKAQYLVDTVAAGGLGLNLQQASDLFLMEPPKSWTDYTQAVARIHRPGGGDQRKVVWRVASTRTVETALWTHLIALKERATEAELALAALRELEATNG
jgi:SNF2 family DNA or RNA helicase